MVNSKKVLVAGAGGFIGHHLVDFLKGKGYWVRGVDIKRPEFSATSADEFKILDLRDRNNCTEAFQTENQFDEIYHFYTENGEFKIKTYNDGIVAARSSFLLMPQEITWTKANLYEKISKYYVRRYYT